MSQANESNTLGNPTGMARSGTTRADGLGSSFFTSRRVGWLLAIFLFLATLAAYSPALHGDFLWDDDDHFSANPLMTQPGGLRALWTGQVFYYPLTSTTFWVERRLFDLNPFPYHLVTVLLHATNAMLLWFVLRRLRVPGAWLAGAIFALHPVNAQSVAWMTELKNTQSGMFYLLALLAWVRWEAADEKYGIDRTDRTYKTDRTYMEDEPVSRPFPYWVWYGLSLLAFLMALLSKTSTVTLPAALLIMHAWHGGGATRGRGIANVRWLVRWAPFPLLALLAGGLTVFFHRSHLAEMPQAETIPERLIIAGRAVWFYLGKFFYPAGLTFVYPRWTINATRWAAWLPLPILALLFALLIFHTVRRGGAGRGTPLALLYFVASLFPVLGFFRMYYTRYTYVADHWQYLAAMGGATWVAASLHWLWHAGLTRRLGVRPIFGPALAGLLLLTLGGMTWRQAHIYQNRETLWLDTLGKNPAAIIAYNNLGIYYAEHGELKKAAGTLTYGLRYASGDIDLLTNLGGVLLQLGQFGPAADRLEAALRIDQRNAQALNNLGLACANQGQLEPAAAHFREAIRQNPRLIEAHNNLAQALLALHRPREAATAMARALAIDPASPLLRETQSRMKKQGL